MLDLSREGGGLTPTRRFGGLQTAVLGFQGRDGRLYSFRGTDKDPSAVLDPQLRGTVVESVVQDQMAAQHPGGPLAAQVISQAAGVLTIPQRMVVMPDDAALGEFRAEFAGMVGSFFEYPTPAKGAYGGFHGATDIIGYRELYEHLAAGRDDAVDVEAFLRARLLDLLLGDFDRHRKQWRWARFPGDPRWRPIPEDRDMAFVRYDGVAPRLAYLYVPILQRYGPDYPWIKGLTLHGWEQDRWLLPHLAWSEWKPIAEDLQQRITDEVIEDAIRALPPEYAQLDGERLRRDLRGRRDRLLEGARSFYEHLAREVDVQASNADEVVTIVRASNGEMRVEVRRPGGTEAAPDAFGRTFDPGTTREVRVYLREGDDTVSIEGPSGAIRLRVIADGGQKIIDDRSGGTRIYDERGTVEVLAGPGTTVSTEAYEPPASDSGFVDVEDVPPRDWGTDVIPYPLFGFEDDVGAFFGLGAIYTQYGFRKDPWSLRHQLSAGYATQANEPRVNYLGAFRPENSKLVAELELQYSGIEILRFYGFGNESKDNGSKSFFRVRNEQFRAAPAVSLPLANDIVRLSAGPWLKHSRTKNGNRFIDQRDPYGSGSFGSVGGFASFAFDTRKSAEEHANLALPFHANPAAAYPTSGFLLEATTQVSPPLWDVERTWGSFEGSLAGFISAGDNGRVTLGLRVGGKATFGQTPYTEAAYIGGGEFFSGSAAIRGYRAQRFAGDESIYGNADLRIFIARIKLLVPGDFGVLGFTDVGRVFQDGEVSSEWHPGWGGGLWFAPLTRANTLSLSVANSEEDTLVYLRLGFHY